MKTDIVIQDRSEMPMQVPHELDDANLTTAQFRVYAHLARRAAKQGRAWPGVDSMAKVCRISRRGVIDAIKALEDRGMVGVRRQEGERNVYILTRRSSWDIYTLLTDRSSFCTGAESGTGGVQNKERKSVQSKKDKGTTSAEIEVIAIGIYDAYPKKVGRPAAIKAIQRALSVVEADMLLELTSAYAKSVEGADPQFIPHPATWFNQERYNDDPKTWPRSDRRDRAQSNRNTGTANEGKSSQYRGVGKVRPIHRPEG